MTTGNITISSPQGMHARPAGELVKLVKGFAPARITLSNGVKTVNAASMLSVLSLGLKCGASVELSVDAPEADEQAVYDAVASFIGNLI